MNQKNLHPEVVIEIDENTGDVSVDILNMEGQACSGVADDFLALGRRKSSYKKREYYSTSASQAATIQQKNR